MIRKILLVLIVCVSWTCISFAAENEKSKEEMRKELREFKMKYLAQELDLKGEQQKKFYQYYGAMMDEKHKIFKEAHDYNMRVKENPKAGEAEYAKASRMMADAKIKEGEIDRKYDAIFAKFLTAKQIYKMKEAEENFRQKIREMRKGKQK